MFEMMHGAVGATDGAPVEDPTAPAGETTTEAPKEEPKVEKRDPLAEIIRQQREARQAKEQASQKAKDAEGKLAEAHAEIEKLRRTSSEFEADPIAYARAAGWSKEKQAYMGQMLLYDLAPEKATADVRQRLFESRQTLKEREAETKRQAEEKAREAQTSKAQYEAFVGAVDQAARSFESGSFPESEDWFGEDHDTYVRSLVATASNLAKTAEQSGKVADLSPGNIARVLETEVARKMKVRDERRGKRQPADPAVQQKAPAAGGKQPTDSTKGLTGTGTPRPKAMTEQERIARAVEAGFTTPGSR